MKRKTGIIIILLLLVAFPLLDRNSYHIYVVNRGLIHAMIAMGLVTLVGFAGQISLGHAAFYGIGAYTSALTVLRLGFPIWLGMVAAVFLCILFSICLSIPAFKLSGFFLSLVTISFGQIIWVIIVNWDAVTNGPLGILNIPELGLFSFRFGNTENYYTLLLVIAFLYFFLKRLTHSFIGRAFMAMRDDELSAETSGINTKFFKLLAFAISAGFGGLAGAFYAHLSGFISPESFVFFESAKFVGMAVVGGLRHLLGGIVGAPLLTLLPEFLRLEGWETYYMMATTFIVVLLVVFMPEGIVPLLERVFNKLFGKPEETGGNISEDIGN